VEMVENRCVKHRESERELPRGALTKLFLLLGHHFRLRGEIRPSGRGEQSCFDAQFGSRTGIAAEARRCMRQSRSSGERLSIGDECGYAAHVR